MFKVTNEVKRPVSIFTAKMNFQCESSTFEFRSWQMVLGGKVKSHLDIWNENKLQLNGPHATMNVDCRLQNFITYNLLLMSI